MGREDMREGNKEKHRSRDGEAESRAVRCTIVNEERKR